MCEVAAHHPLQDAPMAFWDRQSVAVVGHLIPTLLAEVLGYGFDFFGEEVFPVVGDPTTYNSIAKTMSNARVKGAKRGRDFG